MSDDDFDPAPPQAPTQEAPARPSPQSTEQYLLGCCLIDEGATLDKCISAGLVSTDFTDHALGLTFSHLRQMRGAQVPIALDTLVEHLGSRVVDAGGIHALMALDQVGTTARASHSLSQILDASDLRRIERIAKQVQELTTKGGDIAEIVALMEQAKPRERRETPKVRPITSFAYPSDDDPNMLLGSEDYLGRGGGLLFVSHAGAGKSSWAMDACMMWALGRAWMGIKSHHPRKTLIIQAEDSDRYIGKIFASFAHVNKLNESELATLKENCVIIRLKGVSGPAFFTELKALTTLHNPDLVVINPIYLYAQGDITRSEFAQPFLLGLDDANRAEKFAYILIHHTGKPQAKGNNGKRAEVEDWESAYMGFGSSYLANWPRCTILLEPTSGHPGRYQIKLGKGGFNAGITRTVEQGAGTRQEPVTRVAIRHSTDRMSVGGRDRPVYYWEVDANPPAEDAEDKTSTRAHGRPQKYQFSDYRSLFPPKQSIGLPLNELHRALLANGEIKKNILHQICRRWQEEGDIEIIDVHGQPRRYRAAL